MNAIESPCHDPKWDQSLGEALANSASHGLGLLAALMGGPILAVASWRAGDRLYFIGTAVFIAAIRYTHFVWHLFVLLGTACHFLAIFPAATDDNFA
jgi:predicted membrane channel-forming protein YqfA (hemolysin III family)